MYGERLFFTYTGSDGVERELTPGGAARRVTFDNRLAFCRMVEQARTHEFDAQVRDVSTLVFFMRKTITEHEGACLDCPALSCCGRDGSKGVVFNSALLSYLWAPAPTALVVPLSLQQAAAMAAGLADIVPIKVRHCW